MSTYSWWSGTGGDWGNSALWSGGQVPNAGDADVTIAAPGAYTVTIGGSETFTVNALTLNDAGAVLSDSGLLRLGGTLTVKAGRVELHRGAIRGGTIVGDGTELAAGYEPLNTLDGVTVQGGLVLNGNAVFTNGTKVVAADGVSPGVLTLGAVQGSILQINGTLTLHNTIKLENYSQIQTGADGLPAMLTFASDTSVSGDGSVGGTAALVNHGAITADVAGQALELSGSGLTNSGSISETNGATLAIDAGLTNTGTVTATAGTLRIADLVDNSAGTITATNAEIELGNLSTAKLGRFHRSGGRLLVTGTIDNTGQTLDLARGRLAGLTLGGTIRGGTLTGVSGLELAYPYGALMDGVTLLGNLTVAGVGLRLANGAAVRTADGTAPGTITDNGQALILQGAQTFQGMINLAGDAVLGAGAYAVGKPPGPGTDTLTLASASAISGAGTIRDGLFLGESGGQGIYIGPATILNAGSIAATVAGQSLSITPDTFTNAGSLSSILGATLTVAPAHFTNLTHGTLDGGNYFPSGALQLKSDSVLTTIGGADRTDVQLDRQGQLSSWDAATSSYVAFGGTLTTIGAHGNLSLASDTTFTRP